MCCGILIRIACVLEKKMRSNDDNNIVHDIIIKHVHFSAIENWTQTADDVYNLITIRSHRVVWTKSPLMTPYGKA